MNKTSESSAKSNNNDSPKLKPPFKPAKDDTKPVLQDPVISLSFLSAYTFILSSFLTFLLLFQILRSDPIETEEAVLRLPPFSLPTSTSPPKMA